MIIITGASGFIGKHLARQLLEKKKELLLCYHYHDISRLFPRAKALKIDLTKKNELRRLPAKGIEAVVHLAACIPQSVSCDSIENFDACMQGNLVSTVNVLEYCRLHSVKRLVYTSTVSVYGPTSQPPKEESACYPQVFYGWSKLAAEMLCEKYRRDFGIGCFSLRLGSVYGAGQHPNWVISKFIHSARHGKPVTVWGEGERRIDFVYVRDVVSAILCALASFKPGVYNIGSGKPVRIKELARVAVEIFSEGGASLFFDKGKSEDAVPAWLDISKAKKLLGYLPAYSLRKGLKDYRRQTGCAF